MGRKSKKRSGKSKGEGKQRLFRSIVTTAETPPIDTVDNGTNVDTSPKDVNNTMKLLEDGLELLRGSNKLEQALTLKAERDRIVKTMTSLSPKYLEEVDQTKKDLAHTMVNMTTLLMAQCGLVEEEKHSSIVYAEEHADELFDDGGEQFFKMWNGAAGKAACEQKKREEMQRMINDGDTDGQFLMLKDLTKTMDKTQNEKFSKQLYLQFESKFHNTKLDEELFQPCPPKPDCPICFLPMPWRRNESCYMPCCGKTLCDGCIFAQKENTCPFCRDPIATTETERLKKTEKRLEHGDSDAFNMLAGYYYDGKPPLKQNLKKALELMNQAAEYGSEVAHFTLGVAYANGVGVEKNDEKALYHLRLAAIGGILDARHILGQGSREGNLNLAYKHFLIAAEAGHDESLKEVKTGYAQGHVEKDEFEKVLRAHKAASEEAASEQREKAAKWHRRHSSGN